MALPSTFQPVSPIVTDPTTQKLADLGVPVLESARGFFVAGRFDWHDVLAIVLGSTLAWATVAVVRGEAYGHKELLRKPRSVAS